MSDKDRHRRDPPFLIKTQGWPDILFSQGDPGTVFGKDDMVAPELRGNSVEIPDLHWLDGAGRNEPLLSLFPGTVPPCTRTRGTGGDLAVEAAFTRPVLKILQAIPNILHIERVLALVSDVDPVEVAVEIPRGLGFKCRSKAVEEDAGGTVHVR